MADVTVDRILRQLEGWGVPYPREGEDGFIPVGPSPPLEIYSIREIDTTPLLSRLYMGAVNQIQAQPVVPCPAAIGIRPACRFQFKSIPPEIQYGIVPTAIYDAQINCIPWRLFAKGKVEYGHDNNSEEGKDCNKRVYEEEWECESIANSADLLTRARNTLTSSDSNVTFVDNISTAYDKVIPDRSVETTMEWEITGVWDWLITLINIFLTGSCKTRGGIDATSEYEWKGETYARSRHFDIEARVPVRGDVWYTWWI